MGVTVIRVDVPPGQGGGAGVGVGGGLGGGGLGGGRGAGWAVVQVASEGDVIRGRGVDGLVPFFLSSSFFRSFVSRFVRCFFLFLHFAVCLPKPRAIYRTSEPTSKSRLFSSSHSYAVRMLVLALEVMEPGLHFTFPLASVSILCSFPFTSRARAVPSSRSCSAHPPSDEIELCDPTQLSSSSIRECLFVIARVWGVSQGCHGVVSVYATFSSPVLAV